MSPPIRPAATLVLAREGDAGPEVFLSRRTSKAAFMADAWVYPGGRVDDEDAGERIADRLVGPDGGFAATFEDPIEEEAARALYVAGLRESFEEAGVLYARHADGSAVTFEDPQVAERFSAHRAALNEHTTGFADILENEDLTLDAASLDYFAHWITPPNEPRRYDTRFFFATIPVGQRPVPDRSELTEGRWFSPAAALRAAAQGEIQLAPPTVCTLDDLTSAADLAAAIAWAAAEVPVPILPRLDRTEDGAVLVLPGDATYPSETPVQGPTRIVYRDGRFVRE